jgi:hypothetical protein
VQCLAIGLLGKFAFFENIVMNFEPCIVIVHDIIGSLTEHIIA